MRHLSYQLSYKSYSVRHAAGSAFAVCIAVILNHFMSFSGEFWILFTTFLVVQVSQGTQFRQAVQFLIAIMMAIVVANFLLKIVQEKYIIDIVLSVIFVGCSFAAFLFRPLSHKYFLLFIFFPLAILIATLAPFDTNYLMQDRVQDALIGGAIGIFAGLFIFPTQTVNEFREGVTPVLKAFTVYSKLIINKFLIKNSDDKSLIEARITVEKLLQTHQGFYPEWVYEAGFNPALRPGFRYFLITLERISEILFSMHQFSRKPIDSEIFRGLHEPIQTCEKYNELLLDNIIKQLNGKKAMETSTDFINDISHLEDVTHKLIPGGIELLDISPDYISVTSFIRDMKDLRRLLLELAAAVPSS